MRNVTQILSQIEQGEAAASNKLLPLIYEELRNLARVRLAKESPGQTLQATALVHEAYLRLVDDDQARHWNSRGHFFSAAAEAMRRILIEQARRKQSVKRGGEFQRQELNDVSAWEGVPQIDLLALDEALQRLSESEPQKAELVKLRFFAGLSLQDAAQALDISRATAKRHWVYARAWLFGQMKDR